MGMTDREKAARAIGYLEGLSALLWSIGEHDDGVSLAPEMAGYYDDQVETLCKALFEGDGDGEAEKNSDPF